APTLTGVAGGAWRAKRFRRIERQGTYKRLGGIRVAEAHPPRDGASPGFAERRVAESDEPLRIAEALAHRAARSPLCAGCPGAVRLCHDSGHDERAEARAEAVLVNPHSNGAVCGHRGTS